MIHFICFLFLNFSLISPVLEVHPIEKSLQISCRQKPLSTKEDLIIQVTYFNAGLDTIFLPTKYLEFQSQQEIQFMDKEVWCTSDAKFSWPKAGSGSCNTAFLNKLGIVCILPNQSLSVDFSLNNLGCIGLRTLQAQKEYKYRISLHIDERFKMYCKKVWTGSIKSSIEVVKLR